MAECADTDLVERPESLAGGPDLAASRFILSVQMTREEFFAAWRGLMARRAGNWVLILVGGGIVAAGIAEPHIVLAVFGGIFLLCLLLNTFLLAPLQMWRRSDLRHGYDLDISPDGVTAKATQITSTVGWSRWTNFVKCGHAYAYALQARRSVLFVPRRAFADLADEERFRESVMR